MTARATSVCLVDWFRWIGWGAADRGSDVQVHLAGRADLPLLMAVLVAAVAWFGWLYLRDGRRPSWWIKGPLLLLRVVAVLALLAMLVQPTARLSRVERTRPVLAVLADESLSMARVDARLPRQRAEEVERALGRSSSGASRAAIAAGVLNGPKGLIARARQRFDVRLYAFDRAVRPLPGARPVSLRPRAPEGGGTDLATAIAQVARDLSGSPMAGLLVLSDGGTNAGPDPVAAARVARAGGLVTYTAGIGDPTPTRDLAITEVLADQVVRKDNVTQVHAGIVHRGYAGRTVTVRLLRDGSVLESKAVRLGPEGIRQSVSFTFRAGRAGQFAYTVSAPALEGETTPANNQRRFVQRVVTRRLRVLYVEGEPRWEYRYLRNAVLRDPQIAFSCFSVATNARPGGDGNVPIHRFPPDATSLFAYDIVILGDVDRGYFSETQLRALRRFVEDRGGSLVVIAGPRHMPHAYRGTPIEAVLPVRVRPGPAATVSNEPFGWERTAAGRQDPLLRLEDDPAQDDAAWRRLPGMLWNAACDGPKPGATVLAVNAHRSAHYGKQIVLAVQRFGAGRCLLSMVDSTWRWRYRLGDRYFYRFWGQVVRAMTPEETPGGNRFAQVTLDRTEVPLGERIAIHARLLDAFYRPVKTPSVTAVLRRETGPDARITLTPEPGGDGLYAAETLADRAGRWVVRVASPARPDQPATAQCVVEEQALEEQRPELDEDHLRRVARAGGGDLVRLDRLGELVARLPARPHEARREIDRELWDAPWLLAVLVSALALEWLGRRRSGLL